MGRGKFNVQALKKASSSMVKQDRKVAAAAGQNRDAHNLLPIEKIAKREENTRELNSEHLAALAESISVLGLLEPLVIDKRGRLLAGGHRLAAIRLLQEKDIEAFERNFEQGIPVHALTFDADKEPAQALAVEVAENEHRRDYTRDEALVIAERLRKAGYKDTVGRPKKDAKALAPALQTVMGKSLRTVRRLLAGEGAPREATIDSSLRGVQRSMLKHMELFGKSRKAGHVQIAAKISELQGIIAVEIATMKDK